MNYSSLLPLQSFYSWIRRIYCWLSKRCQSSSQLSRPSGKAALKTDSADSYCLTHSASRMRFYRRASFLRAGSTIQSINSFNLMAFVPFDITCNCEFSSQLLSCVQVHLNCLLLIFANRAWVRLQILSEKKVAQGYFKHSFTKVLSDTQAIYLVNYTDSIVYRYSLPEVQPAGTIILSKLDHSLVGIQPINDYLVLLRSKLDAELDLYSFADEQKVDSLKTVRHQDYLFCRSEQMVAVCGKVNSAKILLYGIQKDRLRLITIVDLQVTGSFTSIHYSDGTLYYNYWQPNQCSFAAAGKIQFKTGNQVLRVLLQTQNTLLVLKLIDSKRHRFQVQQLRQGKKLRQFYVGRQTEVELGLNCLILRPTKQIAFAQRNRQDPKTYFIGGLRTCNQAGLRLYLMQKMRRSSAQLLMSAVQLME